MAHRQGGHVHDAEAFFECFLEGEGVIAGGGGIFVWVCGVDAVDFGGFEENLAVEFCCSERGAGVGGEEWVACPCSEDDDAAFFEVADGAASDEGFGHSSDIEGGHDSGVCSDGVEFFFECYGVHDGAEHAHVVCGGLLDVTRFCEFGASDDVASAYDDGDLGASLGGGFDLVCDGVEFFG